MPAKVDKWSIREHATDKTLDRRVKLSVNDKEAIRDRYFNCHVDERPTMTSLAAIYHVDRRLIQFILFPEREARNKQQASARWKEGRYYNKEKGRQNMQAYRDYKRSLIENQQLQLSEKERRPP